MKTDSMTNILKQNNSEISVVKANKILVIKGVGVI
jgi:hypothetical protein